MRFRASRAMQLIEGRSLAEILELLQADRSSSGGGETECSIGHRFMNFSVSNVP